MANTREHRYTVSLTWNGNLGTGTSGYRDYSRNYEIVSNGKPAIQGSATRPFEETDLAGTRKSCSWPRCRLVTSSGICTSPPKLASSSRPIPIALRERGIVPASIEICSAGICRLSRLRGLGSRFHGVTGGMIGLVRCQRRPQCR